MVLKNGKAYETIRWEISAEAAYVLAELTGVEYQEVPLGFD